MRAVKIKRNATIPVSVPPNIGASDGPVKNISINIHAIFYLILVPYSKNINFGGVNVWQ